MLLEELTKKIQQHPRLVAVDDFELYLHERISCVQEYRSGQPSEKEESKQVWAGLRLLHRRQPGESFADIADESGVERLVELALCSAELSSPDPWFRFPLVKAQPQSTSSSPGTDKQLKREEFISELEGTIPETERYESVSEKHVFARREEKLRKSYETDSNFYRIGIKGQEVFFFDGSGFPDSAQIRDFVKRSQCPRSKLPADLLAQISGLDSTKIPVWISAEVAAKLLGVLGHWFCGNRIQNSNSPLGRELGTQLFPKALSVRDLSEPPGNVSGEYFDYEGVTPKDLFLVEAGVIKNFLYDSYVGAKENRASTGNRICPNGSLVPHIAPRQLRLEFSTAALERLTDCQGEILVWTGVKDLCPRKENPALVTARVEFARLREGEWVEVYYDAPCELSLLELFRSVRGATKHLAYYGNCVSPSILCSELPIVSRK